METISEVTKEPTADKPGEMTYIAEFDNDKFTRQEKIVEIEPTGEEEKAEPPGEEEEAGPPDEEAIGIGE